MELVEPKPAKKAAAVRVRGVWVSCNKDGTDVTPHSSELTALRAAKGTLKDVRFVPYDTPIASVSS